MFMDRNRAINGAENPGDTARSDAAEQKRQGLLMTNPQMPGTAEKRTFTPELPHPEQTNAWRVRNFEDSDWPNSYEQHIAIGPNYGGKKIASTTNAKLGKMGKGGRGK